ncbi:MAG: Ig-like domain-containing protein, partial [Raineya sp.]|nr:Ig-like domain-containing protein [Raineya sp.]
REFKRAVVLEFQESFEPNTTYTLNFRKGIQDLNEGNIPPNLQVVFSTGDKLDSLEIKGKAIYLLTNSPASECVVWLAPATDTLKVEKHLPYYLTKTDKNGFFRLQNLKAGTYKLFVFNDKNNNNRLNPEQEAVGFLEQNIILEERNIDSLNIELAFSDKKPPRFLKARPSNTQADKTILDFSKPLEKIRLQSDKPIAYQINEGGKEVALFNISQVYDTLQVALQATDSLGNVLDTTAKIVFLKELRSGKSKKEAFSLKVNNISQGEGILPNFHLELVFSKPVIRMDSTKIYFFKDSDSTQKIPLLAQEYRWNEYRNTLSIRKKIDFQEKLYLQIDSTAFESCEKEKNKILKQEFSLKQANRFAILKLKVNTKETSFIIELLDEKKQLIRTFQSQKDKFSFPSMIVWDYLPAGTYLVRVILDKNANGRWDKGDYEKGILPEKVIFLPKAIPLRENWEITEEFSF